MPSNPSGRIIKTRKGKGGTSHQKNHRWESFTVKIAKLSSLDPLRRVRRHDLDPDDNDVTTSNFKNGLERWGELNYSDGFTTFSREVAPLCDSLPQILHFQDKIMDLLATSIEKKENSSLEPLLALLADFAHDLGIRFEKHYSRALGLLTTLAGAGAQDVEVIEWSFTCLAFMFKYLSKLLVPDLQPTYELIAPLLGKERQQPHIVRFASESMSFLIKKAGAPAHRERSLRSIIDYTRRDLRSFVGNRQFGLYCHGLMTLFAEACKGTGQTIHSSGPAVFACLFSSMDAEDFDEELDKQWSDVVCGVLTSLIHHATPETLVEIVAVLLERSALAVDSGEKGLTSKPRHQLLLSARAIGILAGVRMGSRVLDWPALISKLANILKMLSKSTEFLTAQPDRCNQLWKSVGLRTAIIFQYAPMEAMIPFISSLMDALTKDPLANDFLAFCSYFAQTDAERFRSIVLPYFQRFIITHWSDSPNENVLCVLLPKMVSLGVFSGMTGGKDGFSLPQSWQDQMVSKFERLELSPFPEQVSRASKERIPQVWHEKCLPKYHSLLEVLESTVVHPSTNARLAEILLKKLKLALRPSSTLAPEEAHFIVGRGFSAYVRMSKISGELDASLEPLLRAAAPRYCRLPQFLEAMVSYLGSLKQSEFTKNRPKGSISQASTIFGQGDGKLDPFVVSLIEVLSSESHELRLLSLQLLEFLHTGADSPTSEVLAIMLLIEQTPLSLQSARTVSMHVRKLSSLYSHHVSNPWLSRAIPHFCFGMLTVKFAQLWDDASAALKQIAETTFGEDVVAQLAFEWLETPSMTWGGPAGSVETSKNTGLTDFECSNLMRLDKLSSSVHNEIKDVQNVMLQKFELAQTLVPSQPSTARSQALRVLICVPHIAEKRSRQLVPMFLYWASRDEQEANFTEDTSLSLELPSLQNSNHWSLKDRKAQLELFGLLRNPRSLYKKEDVYSALLKLLGNGDIEVQKSALKALLTWKSPCVKPYQENLLNLLDEARFKDEIAILFQGETLIQNEHRPELMPILLRLLYGRTISRKGAASGKQGMEARRLRVLRNLSTEDIRAFLDIALGKLSGLSIMDGQDLRESVFQENLLEVRKQVGFSKMMEDILKELGAKVLPFASTILEAVLYCVIYASRRLCKDDDEVEEEENQKEGSAQPSQTSMLKVIRQTGIKCLILMFTHAAEYAWAPYMPLILQEIIAPRMEKLPIESAQGVSGILHLLSVWSTSPKTVLFLGQDDRILGQISECLVPRKSKDAVKLYALTIMRNIIQVARECNPNPNDENVASQVKRVLLSANMEKFLHDVGGLLRDQQDISKDLLEACVQTVSELAPFVTSSPQAQSLVDISVFLLDQPSRRVNPKTKSGLLLVLRHFVPLYNLQDDEKLQSRVYNTVTSLFGFFKDRTSREVLSSVLLAYSRSDPVLAEIAALCVDLNSFSPKRLDEPDYDRRLQAFNKFNKVRSPPFTCHQWQPLLFNSLYFITHDYEFAILSTNSSDAICQFIDTAEACTDSLERERFMHMLSTIVIPAIFSGARESSELIRREYVRVLAHLVRKFPSWTEVHDLHGLLNGDDEAEWSFFNNILAPGKGKQSSALGRLSVAAERGEISSRMISHFFIPLVEHFIFDRAEGSEAHSLAAETTNVIAVLASSLEWPQYRAMLRRYISYIQGKPELEKQVIKLLGKVIDALAEAAEAKDSLSSRPVEIGVDDNRMDMDIDVFQPKTTYKLAATMPKEAKLTEDLTTNILPPLIAYLHDKDESTVSLRSPVAVIVVRLLKILPQEQLSQLLPPVLTDICHILRSKAQEARDMTRDTLIKICVLLGPSCFGFVLKELRGALLRGYQLHVLSYTMHAILVATVPLYEPGDLDYCLPSIVAIIMDDIFGAIGQEKDAEEYVSKMKEVKSSKSHDSMELIAKTATLSRLTDLVRPIQILLKEKLNIRMVRKIDELLNRISTGLLQNSACESRESLIFCYEVIQDFYNDENPTEKKKEDYRLRKYLVQKGASKSGSRGTTTIHTFTLVRFALDVLRSVLKKHDNLRTPANLVGFILIIGDAVIQGEEEVKVAALKLLMTIAKVPFREEHQATNLYRVATVEATKCIAASATTTSDISQVALGFISSVLRSRRDVSVKETTIDQLLTRLKDDITEPSRRHVTFNFLRAVLDSKVETAVVYDILDYTGTVMVTNLDKDTRDLARGTYFQFLRDYPQKKSRWSKQLGFILSNLSYDREGGRLSIMEVIHLLLSKSSSDFVQEIAASCFAPLTLVLANDESEECRAAAGELIKEVFRRADAERMRSFLTMLRKWTRQTGNNAVIRLGLQSYGFYYEAKTQPDDSDLPSLRQCILMALETASSNIEDSDWQLIYAALQLAMILCKTFPASMLSADAEPLWVAIRHSLSYPHAWVKLSSARIVSAYFADSARSNSESGLQGLPLQGSHGLKLGGDDISDFLRRTAGMLKTPGLTELLADEIVKNLIFLASCAALNDLKWKNAPHAMAEEVDEDDDIEESSTQKTALQYLFARLSFMLRRETTPPRAPGLIPKTASLQVMQALCNRLTPEMLKPALPTILLPLHNLTDPSIPTPFSTDELFKSGYESLKSGSQEIMSSLQQKLGNQTYSKELLVVSKNVKARREQRSTKRKIEKVSEPEKWGRDKVRKGERKKERRKEKGKEYREQRLGHGM